MGEAAGNWADGERRAAACCTLQIERKKVGTLRAFVLALIVALFVAPGTARPAEPPRNAGYFFERAVSTKPSIHDVGERIRIAKGIDPDRMAEYSGMHEMVSFPDDPDSAQEDFREESHSDLRAEIRLTYAELVSARSQGDEVRRSMELLRQIVEMSNMLYATGKIDQAQALRAQIEWERLSETLLQLEKRDKVFSIRMDILTGDTVESVIPPLEPLREYSPVFDTRELTEAYKSRRFLEKFQKLILPDPQTFTGEELHADFDGEADAFVSVARISLETLSIQALRYRTALIPRAEQAHAARLEAYKTGKLDFPALLEGLRELLEMRKEYQAMLGELHVQKARLESATGRALD